MEGVPIAGDLGDQQSALVGRPVSSQVRLRIHTEQMFPAAEHGAASSSIQAWTTHDGGLQIRHRPAHYALEGSVAIMGIVQWLRDNLG